MRTIKLTPHEIDRVTTFVYRTCGNDFSDKKSLVGSKIGVLCAQLGYKHFYQMWDDIEGGGITSAQVRQQVIDTLTTSYTYFYRECAHYTRLAKLIAEGNLPASGIRVWSAGCATGEEPYNLAMVLEDAHRSGHISSHYQVVGSDISSAAITAARRARYDADDVARMPTSWRVSYCTRVGEEYEVKQRLRDRVKFRIENVLAPRMDAPFDVVMCRNMMIYFDKDAIDQLRTVLLSRVRPGGYLFLGHAEILSTLEGFTYLEPSLWQRETDAEENLLGGLVKLL